MSTTVASPDATIPEPPIPTTSLLRAARRASGLTLEEVSQLVGVTESQLSLVERGLHRRLPLLRARLAHVSGFPRIGFSQAAGAPIFCFGKCEAHTR